MAYLRSTQHYHAVSPLITILCVIGLLGYVAGGEELLDSSDIVSCADFDDAEQLLAQSQVMLQAGNVDDALNCLSDGSKRFGDWAEVWEALGTAAEMAGDVQLTRSAFEKAIELDPEYAVAILKLGNWYASREMDAQAIEYFILVSQLRPESAIPHNNLGLAYMRVKKRDLALQAFEDGLKAATDAGDPQSLSMVLNNLGLLYKEMGQTDLAMQTFEKALQHPYIEAYINIAGTLIEQGDHVRAEKLIRKGLKFQEHPLGIRTLVAALAFQDRIVEAADILRYAKQRGYDARRMSSEVGHQMAAEGMVMEGLDLMSAFGLPEAEDFYHVALQLTELHQLGNAIKAYLTALRIDPAHSKALSSVSMLIYKLGKFHTAEKFFRRIIRLAEEDMVVAEGYNGLGAAIEMTHSRLDESIVCFRHAVALKPDFHAAYFSLVHLLGRVCDWRTWEEDMGIARRMIREGAAGLGPIFALAFPLTDEEMCRVTKTRAAEVVGVVEAHRHTFHPWQPPYHAFMEEKLGVAVVSADFNYKPVGQLVQSMFKLFDRSRFEIFCFYLDSIDGSHILVDIANSVDEFFHVKGAEPQRLAELVNNERPHVLIDFNGYTEGARLEIGAMKPAPIAINYLGFPYTLAIPGYDYILTDRIVTPPELYPSCYTERFALMPNTYMINDHKQSQLGQVNTSYTPAHAAAYNLSHHDDALIFANFNHLQKLGPATFSLWLEAMRRLPNATLWLLKFPKEAERHLRRHAAAHGVDAARLLFTHKFGSGEHLRVKRGASVLLDTLEYNAHVSGLDALWAGLPLVTHAGANMARRCGASFLRTAGLEALVARTPDDYVDVVTRLGRSPRLLRAVRRRVEEDRLPGRLFDTEGWVRDFERMLRAMWDVAAATATQPPPAPGGPGAGGGGGGGTPRPMHVLVVDGRGLAAPARRVTVGAEAAASDSDAD